MPIFSTQSEIESLWKSLLKPMISTCRSEKKVPEELVELIKHNFYAKYVYYDSEKDTLEIGVNEAKQRAVTYPSIEVYHFPLNEVENLIMASFQPNNWDLEFYAKILQGKRSEDRMIII